MDGHPEADVDGEPSATAGACNLARHPPLASGKKLEAIEGNYSSVEREFLADVVLPGGRSVGQMVSSVVENAYLTGTPPRLLAEGSS